MSEKADGSILGRAELLSEHNMYSRLGFEALGTSQALRESWKRPKRHNRTIERRALYQALSLDTDCRLVLADERVIYSAVASSQTRYAAYAAIQAVHKVLPFTLMERDVLTQPEMLPLAENRGPTPPVVSRNPQFEDEAAVPDSRLLERWHDWLWMDDRGVPQRSVDALGASAVLLEGCRSLAASAGNIVEGIRSLL